MTTESEYVQARTHIALSSGEALRIVREWNGLTQGELARLTDIPQSIISALENGVKGLRIDRAKRLANALNVHPAVLAFPDYPTETPAVLTHKPARAQRVPSIMVAPMSQYRQVSGRRAKVAAGSSKRRVKKR